MKTVVAGALGECVHVAGVYNFLRLAGVIYLADCWRRACSRAYSSITSARRRISAWGIFPLPACRALP